MRTKVGIIGAGPAGLLLARLLHRADIDCVVLESRTRAHVERRPVVPSAGGVLEQGTVDALRACGAAARLETEGVVQHGIELRFDRERHRLDLPALTGGRSVTIYPRAEIVNDLVALQLADGPPLLFQAEAIGVENPLGERPVVHFVHDGYQEELSCEWVAGCDGFHGISRHVFPAAARRVYEHEHPYSWLGVLAEVPPSREESVYARGDHGFALHGMRSPSVSRFCLQVPSGTDPADWPDERVWDELAARFAIDADWSLERGPVTAKSVTPMRSHVHEPMRHGRLLLAGGAAHTVAPTGTEGLNLGVYEVCVLARALVELYTHGTAQLLDRYSQVCLDRVWRTARFSYDMTRMLHALPEGGAFDHRLQLAGLRRITASRQAAAELAAHYTGLPPAW
ncbi:4-hydroxybenzoate 3-monooxygenase [Streptomyces bottropensis]|uniref:4-hydroxybenzoate 3-monooxygenase n=1 Tax=Streptomyces bottropensis TaxID=42235 RepID=UPI00367E1027